MQETADLNRIERREEELRKELKKIRNSNLAPEERPMAIDTVHCELSLLKKKKKIQEKNGKKAIKKVIGTSTVVVSVNGDDDKRMDIIIVDEEDDALLDAPNNVYIISKRSPLYMAIKDAKENDLVIIDREHRGRKLTTIIKIEAKSF